MSVDPKKQNIYIDAYEGDHRPSYVRGSITIEGTAQERVLLLKRVIADLEGIVLEMEEEAR